MSFYITSLFIAIPTFVLLISLEAWIAKIKGVKINRSVDMISSLSSGATNTIRDGINEWYNLILGDHGLFIEDYNPKNKTFRNVRRTFGNKGEVVLQVFHDLTDIKFQHEEDGFDDPSPNSVAELIKNNGIRFK